MPKNDRKKYDSVSAMLNDAAPDDRSISAVEFEEYAAERKLVKDLAILRSAKGLSQEDIAKQVGKTQSWVSKLENGTDDELRIGDLKCYMGALGLEFRPGAVKQGATLVDEVKMLSFAIRQRLIALAECAKEGDELVEHIAKFFAESFHNINRFLRDAAAKLPLGANKRPAISIVEMVEQFEENEASHADERVAAPVRPRKSRTRKQAVVN